MQEQTDEFIDAENYRSSKKEIIGYRGIVLLQYQICCRAWGHEKRPGQLIRSSIAGSNIREITRVLEDTRKTTIESTNVLHDILMPKFKKETKEKTKEIYEEIEKLDNSEKDFYDKVLVYYRKLFQELTLFLDKNLHWFEGLDVTDEV